MFKKVLSTLVVCTTILAGVGCTAKYTPGVLDADRQQIMTDRINSVYTALKTDSASFDSVVSSLAEQNGDSIAQDTGCLMGVRYANLSMPNPYNEEYGSIYIGLDTVKPAIYSTLTDISITYSGPAVYSGDTYTFTATVTGSIRDYQTAWDMYASCYDLVASTAGLALTDIPTASELFNADYLQLLEGCSMIPYTATAQCLLLNDGSIKILSFSDNSAMECFLLSDADRTAVLERAGVYTLENIYEANPENLQGAFTEEEWAEIQANQEADLDN